MSKLLISLVLLVFLVGIDSHSEIKDKNNLKRENLKEYLNQKKRSVASVFDEDFYEVKNGHHLVLLSVKMECGQGTCTSHAFVQTKEGSYRYAGEIEGLVTDVVEEKSVEYPIIKTSIRAGQGASENAVWKLNTKKMRYEVN